MKIKASLVSSLLGLACAAASPAFAQGERAPFDTVYVQAEFSSQAQQNGQGILAQSDGRCVVFLPKHVVTIGGADAIKVTVTKSSGATAEADLLRVAQGVDLAMLQAQFAAAECPNPAPATVGIEQLLQTAEAGSLLRVNPSGGSARTHVLIDSYDRLNVTVSPSREGQALLKGMSGSLLVAQGAPLGMLLSVEDGQGVVLRLDRAAEAMRDSWSSSGPFLAGRPVSESRLTRSTVSARVQILKRATPQGRPWDEVPGLTQMFSSPDPMVFVRFADGTQAVIGYPQISELSSAGLGVLGMSWSDPCSNLFDCVLQNVDVYGDVFEEVTVFDYDPEIGSIVRFQVIGKATGCRLEQWCEMDGARVLFTRSSMGDTPQARAAVPGVPAGYQPRTALGRMILSGGPQQQATSPQQAAPSAPAAPSGGGYTPQTELGRQLLLSRCTPGRQALRAGAMEMLGMSGASSGGGLLIGGALGAVLDLCERFLASETERRAAETGQPGEWVSPSRPGVRGTSTVVGPAPVAPGAGGGQCRKVRSIAIVDGKETQSESVMCRAQGSDRWERRG
jgi:surface antigen